MIRAGISKLVVGRLDPDPRMRGRSLELLKEGGIEVDVVSDGCSEWQNEQFLHYVSTGLPFVHLKLAATLDGRIATSTGESKWITGESSRRRGHLLRAEAGAVLVGARTARTDDPTLTARDVEQEPPRITRAVLDPGLTIEEEGNLVRGVGENPLVIFTSEERAVEGRAERLRGSGVEVVAVPLFEGELDLISVLKELGDRGVSGVLVEGGGETAAGFLRQSLLQKVSLFYAPAMLGSSGVAAVGELGIERVADSPRFTVGAVEHLGEDVAITLYPEREKEEYVYRAG
jgi:diaminohydroxyphosphoribosylaminopyrimidine deaminase/5-amino-6-(5-phosphoribosylamino)uracil reductase